jgi:membrane peptidoglycan carboxypeptidase
MLRQPGSAMKPIVYLAAFQQGDCSLETLVPDEPISVPNDSAGAWKSIGSKCSRRATERTPRRHACQPSRPAGRSTPETFAIMTDNSAAPVLAKDRQIEA